MLNEYKSVGTYYNDHSSAWTNKTDPENNTAEKCGGSMPRGPDPEATAKCVESNATAAGNCYFVDSTHSNNWRALRTVDPATKRNTLYVEYDPVGGGYLFNKSKTMMHYEL